MKPSDLDKRRGDLDRAITKAIYWTKRVEEARRAIRSAERTLATQDTVRATRQPIAEDPLLPGDEDGTRFAQRYLDNHPCIRNAPSNAVKAGGRCLPGTCSMCDDREATQ